MDLLNNHKQLFGLATVMFLVLTLFVAIVPALDNQATIQPLPNAEVLSQQAVRGKALFISNGCVACHSQQVRNVEMDKVWGTRPSLSADYAGNTRTDFWRNTATLMGTERTGPDLTDVGTRQPSLDWNLVHLYNPRIVVKESIMPAYPFLFTHTNRVSETDIVVSVPEPFVKDKNEKVIATQDALDLVAYLQSLKQTKLPKEAKVPDFLYKRKQNEPTQQSNGSSPLVDGKALYIANCAACHQAGGEGLAGAFPPLKGSPIVTGENLQLYVDIIMNGYDAREEFGAMSAIGTNLEWTENEVAAIINYERSNWGNKAPKVTPAEIKKIMDFIDQKKK